MKKVTVIRKVPLIGNPYFLVINGDEVVHSFSFKIGVPEDDIYNEEVNRIAAMSLAAKIENGFTQTEEIIYQTPKS